MRSSAWRGLLRQTTAQRRFSQSGASPPASNAIGIAFFSSIVATTFGLGCWQVQRYQWKVKLTAEDSQRYLQEPSTLPLCSSQQHLAENAAQLQGCRVSTTGVFAHDREVLLGPRSAPAGLFGEAAQGLATNPQGYYIITPLKRADGTVVYVNRGWVDLKRASWERPQGQVSLSGVVCQGVKHGSFSPVNDPKTRKLLWLEPAALLQAASEASAASAPDGQASMVIMEIVAPDDEPVASFPAARRMKHLGQSYITPMTHLVYAITWFSLCAAGTAMTWIKFRGGGRSRAIRVGGGVGGQRKKES